MLTSLRNGNLALAFAVELAMLAAFAFAGWAATPILWLRVLLAVALPGLAITMWAVWAAPKAKKRRLKPRALFQFKLVIFAFATLAWVLAGQGFIAAVFGTLAAINLVGIWAFSQY
ncbi:MAG: YrdB family protein [Devosia sp.]